MIQNLPVTRTARPPGSNVVAALFSRLGGDPLSVLALMAFIAICLLSFGAPFVNTYVLHADPDKLDLLHNYEPPSDLHWGGTDALGRDELARVLAAGGVSLGIGFAVAGLQLTIGVILGLIAGYYHGRVDDVISALVLTRSGIPTLYFLILLSVTFRELVGSPGGLAVILALLGWTGVARQVRGLVLSVKERDFVEAARVLGARDRRILFRHILPNVMYIVLLIAGFDIIGAMLGEAGLSYLGLGIQPPTASWGNLLSGSLNDFQRAPWLVFLPGIFISITIFCIFTITDGLRDALDPRLKL